MKGGRGASPSGESPKTRSGTSRSYAERAAKGRPNRTFSMADETNELLEKLAAHHGLSRSAVVELAIRELAKKLR